MADFTALKTAIQQYIAQNGNKEITGNLLQTILLAMVQSMGDQAINDVLQMLSNEMIARENADGSLSQALTSEQRRAIAAETKSAELDGETKMLVFKNAAGQELYQVSVASLISNGLVDVEVDGTNLVMTFHTESGDKVITIPIGDIFNPSNYYTKTQVDGLLLPLSRAITRINDTLHEGALYAGYATPETIPTEHEGASLFYIATEVGEYIHFFSNGDIPVVIPTAGIHLIVGGIEADDWNYETIVTFTNNVQFNNAQLITSGGVFNAILPINELLHRNYILAGVAYTTTIPTEDTNVFYLAGQGGTYTHFLDGNEDPLVLPKGLTVIYRGVEDDGWNYWVVFADNDFINTNRQQALTSDEQVQAQNNMMGKTYSPAQFSGLGKKMLAKNMQQVSGVSKNVMTQAFFEDEQGNALTNTVFVIQYDYTLGEDIVLPTGCTLQFDGGSLTGRYLEMKDNTSLIGNNNGELKDIYVGIRGKNIIISHIDADCTIYQPVFYHWTAKNQACDCSGLVIEYCRITAKNDGSGYTDSGCAIMIDVSYEENMVVHDVSIHDNSIYCEMAGIGIGNHHNGPDSPYGENTDEIRIENVKIYNNYIDIATDNIEEYTYVSYALGITISGHEQGIEVTNNTIKNQKVGIEYTGQLSNGKIDGNNIIDELEGHDLLVVDLDGDFGVQHATNNIVTGNIFNGENAVIKLYDQEFLQFTNNMCKCRTITVRSCDNMTLSANIINGYQANISLALYGCRNSTVTENSISNKADAYLIEIKVDSRNNNRTPENIVISKNKIKLGSRGIINRDTNYNNVNFIYDDNIDIDTGKFYKAIGASSARPSAYINVGYQYFNTDKNKNEYWSGDTSLGDAGWVESDFNNGSGILPTPATVPDSKYGGLLLVTEQSTGRLSIFNIIYYSNTTMSEIVTSNGTLTVQRTTAGGNLTIKRSDDSTANVFVNYIPTK